MTISSSNFDSHHPRGLTAEEEEEEINVDVERLQRKTGLSITSDMVTGFKMLTMSEMVGLSSFSNGYTTAEEH